MNSNTNSPKKMTPSQLEGWLAIRKKCAPQKSKKAGRGTSNFIPFF